MARVEVIDLLSSPGFPSPTNKSIRPLKALPSVVPSSSILLSVVNSESTTLPKDLSNDDWLLLTEDGDVSPKIPIFLSGKTVATSNRPRKLMPPNVSSKVSDSVEFWDIDDSNVDLGRLATAQHASNEVEEKMDNDFFYLSDDLDNTVNLDDPYTHGNEKTNKRRKLESEPDREQNPKCITADMNGKVMVRASSDVTGIKKCGVSSVGLTEANCLRVIKATTIDDDPILFTSSPDIVRVTRERREKARQLRDRELYEEYDGHISDDHPLEQRCNTSELGAVAGSKSTARTRQANNNIMVGSSSDTELPDIPTLTSLVSTSKLSIHSRKESGEAISNYNAERTATQKTRDRARKAEEKLVAKEAEKERKRLAKEDKAIEKQMASDLAKVNQNRIDKKVSTPDMIIFLPLDLEKHITKQVHQFLIPLGVECKEWNNTIPNVIKWRRKVEARYNDELGHWEPVPKHVQAEKHTLCVMAAKEFVALACGDEGHDLDAHVLKMKSQFEDCAIIYLIEGLIVWQRKNKNIKNRQFTEAVRNQASQEGMELGSSSQRSKKRKQPEYIDANVIEDALLSLQVIHGVFIHHTNAPVETAQWIMVFTQHISTVPGRLQKMALDTTFCMDAGQVKTGDNAADTFIKMLQEVTRITAPIAYGIAAEYPSAQKLVAGFEKNGKDMLQNLKKMANKDGAFTDREIGTRLSHRVYNIFMGTDERSTDI